MELDSFVDTIYGRCHEEAESRLGLDPEPGQQQVVWSHPHTEGMNHLIVLLTKK